MTRKSKAAAVQEEIGELAAETTTAFNPIVGAQFAELARAAAQVAAAAARRPALVGGKVLGFLSEAGRIALGNSRLAPDPKDRRYADPSWAGNPLYRRTLQVWLAFREAVLQGIEGIDLDRNQRVRAALMAEILIDSLAPTNTLIGNPAALRRLRETRGLSFLRGLRNAYDDFVGGRVLPAQVDSRQFEVGGNLATSPGAVVFRDDLFELIQYAPAASRVYELPLLIVPPQINKFYVLDLTPDKSMIRFLTGQGFQVYIMSWFNPGPAQRDWGLEDYVDAVIRASDIVRNISRRRKLNVMGACSGGITLSAALSHLAAAGDQRVESATLQVCVLDPRPEDTEMGALLSETTVEFARRKSARKGMLSGKDLSTTFAWMRPNDLIWNYFVNNYLMGDTPPAFDILHWNNDTTNLPARLHSDYLDFYVNSPFAHPGEFEFMGSRQDLGRVGIDMFISSGLTDHITPWRACYRSARLFGGDVTFVASSSGHIQSLVNPPGNPRSRFLAGATDAADPARWLESATEHSGTWGTLHADWLARRSGKQRQPPRALGNTRYKPLDKAPGLYVFG